MIKNKNKKALAFFIKKSLILNQFIFKEWNPGKKIQKKTC